MGCTQSVFCLLSQQKSKCKKEIMYACRHSSGKKAVKKGFDALLKKHFIPHEHVMLYSLRTIKNVKCAYSGLYDGVANVKSHGGATSFRLDLIDTKKEIREPRLFRTVTSKACTKTQLCKNKC